ncbi:DUF2288 family protein [Chondromyces crocatus]|uniref:DUF2288 domain-containing protein n=1 Tax=Chondromyces crocatus TaxID=52 RepID=A0A0K1EP06_CHOCO|nr:DUF2288 family protein [Chondromyces crocatus]AKT42640.1 uncharacterized protein CMC5_068670 [Chondromyces crocatus]
MREELGRSMGEVLWSDLQAHVQRDAVIVLDEDLDLLDAAIAFATNEVAKVEPWIDSGKIAKPTAEELSRWSSDEAMRFLCVIVAPFVLVRRPRAAAPS